MAVNTVLHNHTPFAADTVVIVDESGQETLIVVVRATFVTQGEIAVLADEQPPVKLADEHVGDPVCSSILNEADVSPEKPMIDVLVSGSAYAPGGVAAYEVPVRVEVGDVVKQLIVSGDRRWKRGAPSDPEPFMTMPIVYERAFGGTARSDADPDHQPCDLRNPVGVGFQGARSSDPAIVTEVPNIEYPDERVSSDSDQPRPASLGVVGRGWQPRIQWAGTFDERWLQDRWPILPADFDPRYYQSAPSDQQTSSLRGGERVRVFNMTASGLWTFRLPTLSVPIRYYFDKRQAAGSLQFDTVTLEPERKRVTLVSRARITTVRNGNALREIVIGHMSRGWLRAREQRKEYADFSGRGGVQTNAPSYLS